MNQGVQNTISQIQARMRDTSQYSRDVRNAVSKMGPPAASDLQRALYNVSLGAAGVLTAWSIDHRDRQRVGTRGGPGTFTPHLERSRNQLLQAMRAGDSVLRSVPEGTTREQIRELGALLDNARDVEREAAAVLDWWNRSDEALLLRSDPFISAMFGRRAEQAIAFIEETSGHGSGAGRLSTGRAPGERPPTTVPWLALALGAGGGALIIWLLNKAGV